MKRRTFIKQGTAGVLTLWPMIPLYGGSTEQDYSIIDTHQHLCDSRFKLGWLSPPIDKGDFLIPQDEEGVEGFTFVKKIYMEVVGPRENRWEEAHFALGLAEESSNSTVGAILKATPSEDDFKEYITEFQKNPYLKGVMGRLNDLDVFISDLVTDNRKWLGKKGLVFELLINGSFAYRKENYKAIFCPDSGGLEFPKTQFRYSKEFAALPALRLDC